MTEPDFAAWLDSLDPESRAEAEWFLSRPRGGSCVTWRLSAVETRRQPAFRRAPLIRRAAVNARFQQGKDDTDAVVRWALCHLSAIWPGPEPSRRNDLRTAIDVLEGIYCSDRELQAGKADTIALLKQLYHQEQDQDLAPAEKKGQHRRARAPIDELLVFLREQGMKPKEVSEYLLERLPDKLSDLRSMLEYSTVRRRLQDLPK